MWVRRTIVCVLLGLSLLTLVVGLAAYRAVGTFPIAIPAAPPGNQPGTLVAVERTGKYPAFVVQYILNSAELPEPIAVDHGITLYRVRYRTTNRDGGIVVASGLVALPNAGVWNSVVVYHHGTNAQRHTAPSQNGSSEGLLVAAAAAGAGHVLLAPDYIGLGESQAMHPYMHTQTTVSTSIDFLHAARALVKHLQGQWPTALYLTGFSQGGHATFAVQRELERLHDARFDVQASAPIAGPFHLREVSFPQALTGTTKSHSFYLAYLASSYAKLYDRPLQSILTAAYAEQVPVLFDGAHESDEISAALPAHPRDLFNPEFLQAYDNGKSHWFLDALAENNVDDWTPAAPSRIYYGDNDVDVLPEEARRAAAAMKRRGADITAISVGPHDHDASALRAIPQAIRWFTDLSRARPAR
jgi:pimeloyl-ACP methyl ester carboxylesterase